MSFVLSLGAPYRKETLVLIAAFIDNIHSDEDKYAYENVFAEFGRSSGVDIMDAGAASYMQYLNSLVNATGPNRLKLSTIVKRRKILASFIAFCLKIKASPDSELYQYVPVSFRDQLKHQKLSGPPEVIRQSQVPTVLELDTLFGWLRDRDGMLYLAVLLSSKCLLKSGEFLRLKRDDVCVDASGEFYLIVRSRKAAAVHVPSDMSDFLDEYAGSIPPGGYLFFGPHGYYEPVSNSLLSHRLKQACKASCLMFSYTFNDLRMAGGAYALSGGADLAKLNDKMGYKNQTHAKRFTTITVALHDDDLVNIYIKKRRRREVREDAAQ